MLAGRVALVTGSTSGIGLGVAHVLASHGARLVLNGLDGPDVVDKLQDEFSSKYGTPVTFSGADLRKPAEIEEMMAAQGNIDILVNNAGIQHVSPVEDFPLDKWQAIMDINLTSNFLTLQAALPAMRQNGWGRVINVASVHGRVASVHKAAYVAAKHGVLGLTKVVALETARSGITCNAICPGWVLTPLVEQQIRARASEKGTSFEAETETLLEEKQPSGRFVTPEDIGGLAAFLCSDAAANITGEDFAVDGGWTAV